VPGSAPRRHVRAIVGKMVTYFTDVLAVSVVFQDKNPSALTNGATPASSKAFRTAFGARL
jgi:hypothetical protein